jgi:hypothetical protein
VKETVPSWRFDLEACLADFETIRDLNPATLLYIHFEPHSSPEALLAGYEEVLTGWVATVETKREELGVDDAIVEHFVNETECSFNPRFRGLP